MKKTLEQLGDEQAIRDVLSRYWRGIDRRDRALVAQAYHEDARDDHGYYQGPVDGFLDSLEPGVWSHFERTQHFSGHIDVELTGADSARTESYAEAHHIRAIDPAQDGGQRDDLVYGLRYVDDLTRRDGVWRIANRVCVWDWHRIDRKIGMPLPDTYYRGDHSKKDPVYRQPVSSGARVEAEDLIAIHACQATLMRYARGVDRCDPELVRSTYHSDAYDDHGGYQGNASGFIDWVQPTVMDAFSCTMHKLGNMLIEVDGDGDRAFAETYAIAHHVQAEGPTPSDMIMGVRYLDRLEQRSGEWKIAHREMSFEWERAIGIYPQDVLGSFKRGRRDGLDPVLDLQRGHASDDSSNALRSRSTVPVSVDVLSDRSAIYDVVAKNCRAVDRNDETLLRETFHTDATVDQGTYFGNIDGLVEVLRSEVHERFRITSHKLGQVLIEVDGDSAQAESYQICHHVESQADADAAACGEDHIHLVVGVRCLDDMERRDGRWRISKREIRFEWIRAEPLEGLDPNWTCGRADPSDPSYLKMSR